MSLHRLSFLTRRPRHTSVRSYGCSTSNKVNDPLRILFCGSDEFSIVSLQALNEARREIPDLVTSIDVVCRPEKPVQRNLKALREGFNGCCRDLSLPAKISSVPIADVARNLNLPLHQIDSFTGWKPPTSPWGQINLIIAVSIGLLVPSRILHLAEYGGLNVHPSMLPEFRGPAPLHHTLLTGRETTGVTLQTLHPSSFDEGEIIAQTPYPGIKHGCKTVEELRDLLAPIGAQMLVQAIKDRSFVQPIPKTGWRDGSQSNGKFTYASKIGPKDRHIDWATWTASDILRRQQIIGPLWNMAEILVKGHNRSSRKRVIWDQGFHRLEEECHIFPATGHPIIVGLHGPVQHVYVRTCDGQMLVARPVKMEGGITDEAIHAVRRSNLAPISMEASHDFVPFHSPLE
ncbi:MAG: hypothetical protein Q9170_001085 [Blastenia crenularia]